MRFFKLITGQWPESFLGTTNIELTKRLLSSSATFIATFFNICSICWSTKTFSWEDHLNKWGRRFLNRNDRKGIWYPFTMFKMEGSLASFSQFSKNYWRRLLCWNFWNSFGNKPLNPGCMCEYISGLRISRFCWGDWTW